MEGFPVILLRIKMFKMTTYHTQMDLQPAKLSNIYLKISRQCYNNKLAKLAHEFPSLCIQWLPFLHVCM